MTNYPYKTLLIFLFACLPLAAEPLKVVTTLPDYADFAKAIGGDRVIVTALVRGDQDAHFIRPKPSFISHLTSAEVLISTGLDMELWLPTIIDKSGNPRIRSEQRGYVSASEGMELLEVPQAVSRMEGGVHVYGNPHVSCSPIHMKQAARNITSGLIKNDPDGAEVYRAGLKALLDRLDTALYGEELPRILGSETLDQLASQGRLVPFLKDKKIGERPLVEKLGGWMGRMLPLYGKKIVTYHKNWVYFTRLFGLMTVGTVEPKPGIPPSARHVIQLMETMRSEKIGILLAANYFDHKAISDVAQRTGAQAVIVPLYVGGEVGVETYFDLVDLWVSRLLEAEKALR